MISYREIYEHDAAQYDLLVSREDHQGNLLPAIERVASLDGARVIELGAGTGRITVLITARVKTVRGFDSCGAMLNIGRAKLRRSGATNWDLAVADHRALPAQDGEADVVIAAWSLCHLVDDYPESWMVELQAVIAETRRVLRPGGVCVLLETLGTGHKEPCPPKHLEPYFRALEEDFDFQSTWLRTDYRFQSMAEGEALTRLFFGVRTAEDFARAKAPILPECTGLWYRRY